MALEDRITVVIVCDNHYMIMLAALIKSLEINHKTGEEIDIYIVGENIRKKNKARLNSSVDATLIKLHWLRLSTIFPRNIHLPKDKTLYPVNIYARLFIPFFLPLYITKVLYLDVDMIFQEDISKLWQIKMSSRVVAAVLDRTRTVSNPWARVTNYKELGLSPDTKYFNSGLFIIDTDKWRDRKITEKVLACIKENISHAVFPDQYGLNVVLAGQWIELDPRWNCQSVLESTNPYIIHFTGRKPIYLSYDTSQDYNSIYKDEFHRYLAQTEWRNYNRISEYQRMLKKLYIQFEKKIWFMKRWSTSKLS